MSALDDPPIQLYGGPCDGEMRRFDPSNPGEATFWTVPFFGEHDPFYHQTRHWYGFDATSGKAKYLGRTENNKEPWKGLSEDPRA